MIIGSRYPGDQLVLHFTLPVVADIDTHKEAVLDVYDPSFFVDFAFADKKPCQACECTFQLSCTHRTPQGVG